MTGRIKKILKKLACVYISILLMTVSAKATLVDSNSIVEDGIEYYIQTDKAVYDLGGNVEILYRVTNVSTDPIDIGMVLRGPWVDFFVTADDNTDIWQYVRIPPMWLGNASPGAG
jgi:hypothetical protein